MDKDEILSGLILELRRGTIVLCALSQLKRPTYGYHLVSRLAQMGIPVEANTLYPLLRRLEAQGLLSSSWELDGPKPRKYYVTTEVGSDVHDRLKNVWESTVASMNALWSITQEDE